MTKMNTVNTESDNFNETEIDFESHQIIASFTAIKRSGSTVKIDSLFEYKDQIKVFVGDPVIGGFTVISQPYYIVKIPVSIKAIYFE